MENQSDKQVFGPEGLLGTIAGEDALDQGRWSLALEGGGRAVIDPAWLRDRGDGTYELSRAQADALTLPIYQEELEIGRRRVPRGKVVVHLHPVEREEHVTVHFAEDHAEVERRSVDRLVDAKPAVREEGDTVIIPVVEEVVVLEKKLLLKEEILVSRKQRMRQEERSVRLRSEEAEITREEDRPGPR